MRFQVLTVVVLLGTRVFCITVLVRFNLPKDRSACIFRAQGVQREFFLNCLTLEDKEIMFLRSVGNHEAGRIEFTAR
jgi:hypothetical protein